MGEWRKIMKLSISNIAWNEKFDEQIYELMQSLSYKYLEIAPTRVFPQNPYDDLQNAGNWSNSILDNYGIAISSMQSIWFGRNENIFNSEDDRKILIEYTKKAVDFAETIGCKNLVFGCPKNRALPNGIDSSIALEFFKTIGDYAYEHNTVIGLEANPAIYNTNYINTTSSAVKLINDVNSNGFKLNLDIGTMIANNEDVDIIENNVDLINHVHISEPYLEPIQQHMLHKRIAEILSGNKYAGCVSIEMKNGLTVPEISEIMKYVRGIFS